MTEPTKTPLTKKAAFDAVVAELHLDVRDPFTLLIANAIALVEQRDRLHLALAAANERAEKAEQELAAQTAMKTLLDASDAYSNAQWDVELALEKMFGESNILGIAWDSYDSSLEIYAIHEDIMPTPEQRDAILAMGFIQFWINFSNGEERHCAKDYIGERRRASYNRWDAFNHGHLKFRKLEKRLAAAESQLAWATEDAERYRWLRDKQSGESGTPAVFWDTGYGEGYPRLEGDKLDAAIDKARKG